MGENMKDRDERERERERENLKVSVPPPSDLEAAPGKEKKTFASEGGGHALKIQPPHAILQDPAVVDFRLMPQRGCQEEELATTDLVPAVPEGMKRRPPAREARRHRSGSCRAGGDEEELTTADLVVDLAT
jgi:hypothetical protein